MFMDEYEGPEDEEEEEDEGDEGETPEGEAPPPPQPKITADQVLGKEPVPGEKPEGEEEPTPGDPLSKLSISDLLQHPTLGRQIQSWADTSGNSRLEAERRKVREDLEQEYEFGSLQAEFGNMTKEDWQELVSEDPQAIDRYARYSALIRMRETNQTEAQIAKSAEMFALADQIKTYQEFLKGSGLPADKMAALNPDNFTTRQDGTPAGRAGVIAWGNAIFKTMVDHELESRWEAYLQDRLAERDKKGKTKVPVMTNGQNRGGIRLTREVLKNMDPDEILKLPQEDIDRVLAAPK